MGDYLVREILQGHASTDWPTIYAIEDLTNDVCTQSLNYLSHRLEAGETDTHRLA